MPGRQAGRKQAAQAGSRQHRQQGGQHTPLAPTWVAGERPVNAATGVALEEVMGLPPFRGVAVKMYCRQQHSRASVNDALPHGKWSPVLPRCSCT